MAKYAMGVAGALKAYASNAGNATLRDKAEINPSDFTHVRDDQRDDIAQGERSMHTELLKQEFARADVIAKERLDGLVLQLEKTNQPFVMTYQNARKVTDTGSTPKHLKWGRIYILLTPLVSPNVEKETRPLLVASQS